MLASGCESGSWPGLWPNGVIQISVSPLSPSLYAAFVAATVVLMLVPGPNVALIVANSLAFGARVGLVTVLGTILGMIVQLSVAAFGVTALVGALAQGFNTLRWLGVVYLLWLGVRDWRTPAGDLSRVAPVSPRRIFIRGFLVSLTNPKPLVFYAAFLPQFLVADAPLNKQMAILSVTFVAIGFVVDSGWAFAGARARGLVARFGRARNRLTGAILVGAGAALGLALARL
jgi:homoserine/homoserine lactone efflux protein